MKSRIIIADGYVLTCDSRNRGGRLSLLIADGRIAEVTDSLEQLRAQYPEALVVDATGKLIVPGFVNAHYHGESQLLRYRTDGMHFSQWQNDPRFNESSEMLIAPSSLSYIRSLYLSAYFGHLKCGTTCVGEFGPPLDGKGFVHLLQAIERTDVKCVAALQNWDQIQSARDLGSKRPPFLVNLGREEDFTVYSFENLVRTARELQVPIVAHIAEQRDDVDVIKKNFQKGVLAVLRDYGVLQSQTVLVHLNHIPENEIGLLKEIAATVVVCARSAARKQSGYPLLRRLMSQNIRLGLGTDWGSTDMMEEVKFMNQLPFVVPGFNAFSAMELLRMATINGAAALGRSGEIGSIEAGKRADITFFRLTDLRLPMLEHQPTAQRLATFLVNNLSSRDISDVMIDGEFCVSEGQLMTMLEEDVVTEFRATYEKFYPSSGQSTSRRIAGSKKTQTTLQKGKILPFLPDTESVSGKADGFEEGFSVVNPAGRSDQDKAESINLQPPPPTPKEQYAPRNPQLSGDVKRVFGEEEEF